MRCGALGSVSKAKLIRSLAIAFALLAISHPVIRLIADAGAYAPPASAGVLINAASGEVISVDRGSTAAAAGLRAGDRVDFARTGSLMHLWLWDCWFPVGKPVALPVVRAGREYPITIVATAAPLDANTLSFDIVYCLVAVVLIVLGCTAVFAGVNSLTLAFYALCFFFAASENTGWLRVASPALTPVAALESALPVFAGSAGLLFLCLRFPTGDAIGRWRSIDRAVIPFACLLALLYYLHFYESAFVTGTSGILYRAGAVLLLLGNATALAAFIARFSRARGPEITRMRWVAAAVATYLVSYAIFFTDQIVSRSGSLWAQSLFTFNPAPYAFAYALVRGRIIDIRIVGGRAVIYALVSSVPIALLAFVDWFFGRRLEDARLATAFEVGIAIGFSFWLRALHRRIDQFAERVFFAARHRAFQRVRYITQALPFAEKISTIESLLTEETALVLNFTSAALFRFENGLFVRTSSTGWQSAAEVLDGDDPMFLFARSAHHGVNLSDAPQSKARLPGGENKPAYALPIVVGRRVISVVLYGGHRDGEAIDAEEDQLLSGLARAAATAYEHLHALERERENATLRAQLQALGVVT
jgi:hypothetical protein